MRREERVWRGADGYVTITSGLADELQERFGARPALAVVARRRARAPRSGVVVPGGRRRTPVVGYAGHLYPWKGVDVLLDALAELPGVTGLDRRRPPGGARPGAAAGAGAASWASDSRVDLHRAWCAPREVAARLATADVLVLPNPATAISARYTSPLKLFEYLAMGRPIVASDLPAFREVLTDGENAVLVEPGQRAALAARHPRACSTTRRWRRDGARQARETARDYSWDRRAERLDALFERGCRSAAG